MKQVNKIMVLLMVATMMAGCADVIPDLPNGEEVEVVLEWTTLNGEYTVLVNYIMNDTVIYDENNSTYSTVTIGTNNTWVIVKSFNWTATHLSFDIVNNTVIFNNFTFDNDGYVSQPEENQIGIMEDELFSGGYAPKLGSVDLFFPNFPYDITVNYTVVYRTVNGR